MGKVLCRVIGGGSSVGTAKAGDVIKGKTFSNDDDVEVQGTLQGTGTAIEGDVLKGCSFYNTNLQNRLSGTLELTGDAGEYDTIKGKTFYSNNAKVKKTGTLPEYPSGSDAQSCTLHDNYVYYRINKGAYRSTWSGDQTEVKYPALSVIAALGIASITSFKVAQYGPNTLRFTWAKPSKGLWSGVHIIGKLNSWPTSPTDGSRSWDSGDTYKDSGSIETGTWYFRAYSYITWTGGRYYSQNPEGSASIYNTTSHGNTTLTGSTKWTVPAGCNYITAFLVGGGGGLSWPWCQGGHNGSSSGMTMALSNGAAGGYTKTQGFSVTPGETLTITVGAGGVGNGGTSAVYHQNGSLIASAAGGGAGTTFTWPSSNSTYTASDKAANGGSGGGGASANWHRNGSGINDNYNFPGKGGSDGSDGESAGYVYMGGSSGDDRKYRYNGGSGQGYSTKAWGNTGQPYSPGCGGGSMDWRNVHSPESYGSFGAGLTGNNSGAAANRVIVFSRDNWDSDHLDAGSVSGSSGVVLLKW